LIIRVGMKKVIPEIFKTENERNQKSPLAINLQS
jgi:hypothetical protein